MIIKTLASAWLVVTAYSSPVFSSEIYKNTAHVPVGTAFVYAKANADGSNLGYIAVYYKDTTRIESFKWHEGHSAATIVEASLSPVTHHVTRFEARQVLATGTENVGATLERDSEGTFHVALGDSQHDVSLPFGPWHSYDFDFASLGYVYRYIAEPKAPYSFDIFDIDFTGDVPKFGNFGSVTMSFLGYEERDGSQVATYTIDGPGLDNRGGTIWFDTKGKHLVGFNIEKPDERSYDSGNFNLKEVKVFTQEEWIAFKKEALRAE